MLVYLIKSAACLAIFMAFYKLFLEKENMHVFKRLYLVTALIVAFGIPQITFTQYIEVASISSFNNSPEHLNYQGEELSVGLETNYLAIVLWGIYFIGVLLFATKFIYNLVHITRKIKRNPKEKSNNTTRVLMKDLVTPHTFFNYLFLNQQKYQEHQIPQEVLWHEETHAIQKHSIDILFVELLQVIFWFNPLIYFIKRSIKMNHEFLADQSVLNKGVNASKYQRLLLAFSSNAAEIPLANAINYSFTRQTAGAIKKRFTVMKTQTSKQKIIFKSFFLLPLLAISLYGFSTKEQVVKATSTSIIPQDTIQDILVYIDKANTISLQGNPVSIMDLETEIDNINPQLTKLQKQNFVQANIQYEDEKSLALTKTITNILFKSGVSSVGAVNINNLQKLGLPIKGSASKYTGKTLSEANNIYAEETIDLSSIKTDSINSSWKIGFEVHEITYEETHEDPVLVTAEMLKEYNAIAKSINSQPATARTAKLKDYNKLEYIYSHMSDAQKKVSEPFPSLPIYTESFNQQKKATPEEVKEYNKLAKQMNSQSPDKFVLNIKDMRRLKELHDKMSSEQRAHAEPLPNFPPPPPPSTQNDGSPITIPTNNTIAPPPPPPHPNATMQQKQAYDKAMQDYMAQRESYTYKHTNDKGEVVDVIVIPDPKGEIPPPPPPPASPIEHIKSMQNKGALFFFNTTSITAEQALKYVKENENLKISTKQMNSEQPKVYISKD